MIGPHVHMGPIKISKSSKVLPINQLTYQMMKDICFDMKTKTGEKKNHWFPSDTLQIPVVRNDSLSLIALTAPQSGITLTTLQGNMG